MEYRIEKLSAENIRHLIPLYKEVFHEKVSHKFLLKKYDTRSVGPEYIGFIAYSHNDIAVAFYGVIPCFFQLNGKKVVAAQSADTMTHPDHRKKGLFQNLALKTYALAAEQGIKFVFGFPNQDSFPGFMKLNWQFLPDQLQVFTIKAASFNYSRLLYRIPGLFSLYNILLNGLLGVAHPDNSFFKENISDGIIHDDTFCLYKKYHATHIITINKVKAWIKVDGKLKVGAVQGLNENNAAGFLNRLATCASLLGCAEVIFMTTKHSLLYEILKKTLTPKDAFPVGFLPLHAEKASLADASFEYCDADFF
ncbi:MAG TPA: GNAT family N-acetyltransferase [Chryseolinea sp.]